MDWPEWRAPRLAFLGDLFALGPDFISQLPLKLKADSAKRRKLRSQPLTLFDITFSSPQKQTPPASAFLSSSYLRPSDSSKRDFLLRHHLCWCLALAARLRTQFYLQNQPSNLRFRVKTWGVDSLWLLSRCRTKLAGRRQLSWDTWSPFFMHKHESFVLRHPKLITLKMIIYC